MGVVHVAIKKPDKDGRMKERVPKARDICPDAHRYEHVLISVMSTLT